MAGEDENLEILFWWVDNQPDARIEDELDAYLTPTRSRRRRLLWPARRATAPASAEVSS